VSARDAPSFFCSERWLISSSDHSCLHASYLQFFFNLSLVLILLYLAVQFILTVKADINRKVEEVSFGQSPLSCSRRRLWVHLPWARYTSANFTNIAITHLPCRDPAGDRLMYESVSRQPVRPFEESARHVSLPSLPCRTLG
jgi:hypothetical protein